MKSDTFDDQPQPEAKEVKQPANKSNKPFVGKPSFKGKERANEKPKEKEATMEEKLAMLMNKFKK